MEYKKLKTECTNYYIYTIIFPYTGIVAVVMK